MTDNLIEEWKEARSTIARFDSNVFDLRKYGFTFITGLLTADGFLSTKLGNSDTSHGIIQATILANVILTMVLQFYENTYLYWQKAAIIRSELIEKKLNIELTENISFLGKRTKTKYFGFVLYGVLILSNLVLSLFLTPDPLSIFINHDITYFGFWMILALAILGEISIYKFMRYHDKKNLPKLDWTIDKIHAKQGDVIRLICTNISPHRCEFVRRDVCEINDLYSTYRVTLLRPFNGLILETGDSFVWNWTVPSNGSATYRFTVFNPRFIGKKIISPGYIRMNLQKLVIVT